MASKAANSRKKGIEYENLARRYFKEITGLRVFNPASSGVEGSDMLFLDLPFIVGEAKNHKKSAIPSWLKQAREQAEREQADLYFVIHKRHGVGNEVSETGVGLHNVSLDNETAEVIRLTLQDNGLEHLIPLIGEELQGKKYMTITVDEFSTILKSFKENNVRGIYSK